MKKTSKTPSTVAASPATSAAIALEIASVPSVSAASVDAFVAAIDAFAHLLGSGFVVPQPDEMMRRVKPRKEAPTIVPMVADISTRYGIASTSFPTSAILARQQLVNSLAPVVERIAAVQKLVVAVIAVGQSGAWEGAMVTYGLLKNEARGNAVLRNALAPVREKLRPTYQTADGGTTKLRSRSIAATAKGAAPAKTPKGKGGSSAPVTVPEAPAETAPSPAPVAPSAPPAAPATHG